MCGGAVATWAHFALACSGRLPLRLVSERSQQQRMRRCLRLSLGLLYVTCAAFKQGRHSAAAAVCSNSLSLAHDKQRLLLLLQRKERIEGVGKGRVGSSRPCVRGLLGVWRGVLLQRQDGRDAARVTRALPRRPWLGRAVQLRTRAAVPLHDAEHQQGAEHPGAPEVRYRGTEEVDIAAHGVIT